MDSGEARKARVLVVGGQFAGRRVAQALVEAFDVVMVDAKPAFEYTPSLLRCLVEPAHAHNINVPHAASVEGPRVVVGTVHSVDAAGQTVTLTDGTTQLPYDYLVIAAGSSYASPIKLDHQATAAARIQEIQAAAARLADADSIVVVGGGPVGVELAAEVIGKFGSTKKVTLVCSADRLLRRMPSRAGAYALEWLQKQGVEVLLGHRVVDTDWDEVASSKGPYVLQTDGGYVLKCDLVYNCIGVQPNTLPFAGLQQQQQQPGSDQEQLQEHAAGVTVTAAAGQGLQVLPTLQVAGQERVFACGDVAALPFEKTAFVADLSAGLVAANIRRLAAQEPLLLFPQDACFGASSPPTIMAISLYKHDGILQFNRLVLTGSIAVLNKVAIEQLQLAAARNRMVAKLWNVFEKAGVLMGRWLLR